MSRPNSRQRVDRAFGRGSGPSPYGRGTTWSNLPGANALGFKRSYRPKRKRPYKGPEWRTPGHRNTLS